MNDRDLHEDEREPGGPGEPGGEGEEGTREKGGKGGEGGGGGEGGRGGPRGERGPTGGTSRLALIGYGVMALGVFIALFLTFRADRSAEAHRVELERTSVQLEETTAALEAARDDLCRSQADLVDMQELFLAEHAAIRDILHRADLPTEHASPDLLADLAILIDRADCDPDELQEESENSVPNHE